MASGGPAGKPVVTGTARDWLEAAGAFGGSAVFAAFDLLLEKLDGCDGGAVCFGKLLESIENGAVVQRPDFHVGGERRLRLRFLPKWIS